MPRYCRECGAEMDLKDTDKYFKDCFNNYWKCAHCRTSVIVEVRFNQVFRELWHSENDGVKDAEITYYIKDEVINMANYEVQTLKINWVEIGKNIDRKNTLLSKEELLDVIDGLILDYERIERQRDESNANYKRCKAELEKCKKINASLIANEIPEEVKTKVFEKIIDLFYEV